MSDKRDSDVSREEYERMRRLADEQHRKHMAALAEIHVLRAHLSDDLLLRLAVLHGWPHEPDNPQGVWCCDEHRQAFNDGRLWANG